MKIGIIGNGGIVMTALEALRICGIEVSALWCRNEAKGKPVCVLYGIEKLYTDIDAFLQEDFDTVYVGLINSLHYEYTKKALEAGKNVICEKPFTSTYAEAKELADLAKEKGVFLFEAIMLRYSANYEAIRKNLDRIGNLRIVRSCYSQYSRRYDDYLQGTVLPAFDPKFSGGALYDINVYNIHMVTGLLGRPEKTLYSANTGFNGIDTSGILLMEYDGFKAVCTGAKDCGARNETVFQGDKGYIINPERPGVVRNVTLHLNDGTEEVLDVQEEKHAMAQEFRRIAEVIAEDDQETADRWLQSSLTVMEILERSRKDIGLVFPADRKYS